MSNAVVSNDVESADSTELPSGLALYFRAFVGLFRRDLRVLQRQFVPFVVRTIMNPLLFVFVFTYLFPKIGQGFSGTAASGGFGTVVLPRLVAVGIIFQGIAAVALPLAVEFNASREIDDRIMSPLPVEFVAVEKVVFSAMQSVLAAIVIFPLAYYIPTTPVVVHVSSWPLLIAVVILASLVSGALGLVIGTAVQPAQIGLVFSIIVVPVTFFGCVYYPWAKLDQVRWLQIAVLVNPLVYMSEGLRLALTPQLPHMPAWLILMALLASLLLLGWIGMKGFLRKVLS